MILALLMNMQLAAGLNIADDIIRMENGKMIDQLQNALYVVGMRIESAKDEEDWRVITEMLRVCSKLSNKIANSKIQLHKA